MPTSSSVNPLHARTRRSGRRLRASLAAAGVLVTLAACAKKDMKSEMSRVRSWTATTKLASEMRGVGSTNAAVTRQLLERAEQTHAKEAKAFVDLAKSDSQRVAARELLDSLQQGIARLGQVAR